MPSQAVPPPLPSSGATVIAMVTVPGSRKLQSFAQASVLMLLPSSHSSPPLTMPSPQKVQLGAPQEKPVRHGPWDEGAPVGKAPPSQVSQASLIIPSPQVGGGVQLLRQPSVSTALPSSHTSSPLTMPSPQKVQPGEPQVPVRHGPWDDGALARKASPSHFSQSALMTPSPHSCRKQLFGQASLSMLLPSSQNSPSLTMPSPQKVQSLRQVRPEGARGWNAVWSQVSPDPACRR